MDKYLNVLFDLDGTLTDPKVGITKSVQYALSKFNIWEPDLDRLQFFIGPPLQNTFIESYSFTQDEAWEAVGYYREYFKEHGIYENEIYPGIPQLLNLLLSQGRSLFVATSKPRVFAQDILSHFQLDSYFTYVCGSELDGSLSDKTEIIQYIIDHYQLNPENSIMIGDRKHDLIGASHNHMHSIGVGFGYGTAEELKTANATYQVQTVQELLQLFRMIAV